MIKNFLHKIHSLKSYGNSMEPILHEGDVIFFKPAPFIKLDIDDIITFRKKNHFITHRIVYKTTSYVITKGDSAISSDGKISPERILGKVYRVKRGEAEFTIDYLYLLESSIYYEELLMVNQALESFEFVFLKGLPVYLYYFKTYPKRIYADCDLLIRKEDEAKISIILQKLGYKKVPSKDFEMHRKFAAKKTEISFYKTVKGFPVVLDIHLEPVFLFATLGTNGLFYPQEKMESLTDKFLSERKIIKVKDERFPILTSEDFCVYLSLHFFHHNYRGLYRLKLLSKVFPAINKGKFMDTISRYSLEKFTYPALYLLQKKYKVKLALNKKIFLNPRRNMVISYILKTIQKNLFLEEGKIESRITRFLYVFSLSPQPFHIKLRALVNLRIWYGIWWVFYSRLYRKL